MTIKNAFISTITIYVFYLLAFLISAFFTKDPCGIFYFSLFASLAIGGLLALHIITTAKGVKGFIQGISLALIFVLLSLSSFGFFVGSIFQKSCAFQ